MNFNLPKFFNCFSMNYILNSLQRQLLKQNNSGSFPLKSRSGNNNSLLVPMLHDRTIQLFFSLQPTKHFHIHYFISVFQQPYEVRQELSPLFHEQG